MRCFGLFTLIGWLMISFGCAATSSRDVAHVEWQVEPAQLGRVAVLIDFDQLGPEDHHDEKKAEIREILRTSFQSIHETKFLDATLVSESLGDRPWAQASDYELIMASREHDVDALAIVRMQQYLGSVAIGFMPLPGWSARTDVAYRLRVLDVATGQLLADLHRHRWTGGFLGYSRRSFLARDFENDLAEVVASGSSVD